MSRSGLRVLVAHSFYRVPGGEDGAVRQQVELLSRRHHVELLARQNADLTGGLSTARRMTFSSRERSEVESLVDRFRPDVIHLHNAYPALGPSVHLVAHKRAIPLVMTMHNFRLRCPNGYMFTEGEPCRRCEGGLYHNAVIHRCFPSRSQAMGYATALWAHRVLMRLDDKVDLYMTPSDFMRRRMLDWGFEDSRVEVVRNFTTGLKRSERLGSYGLYLGRISSEKGIDVLLRSLSKAGDPPFKVAGDGPVLNALQELAAGLGLHHTEFLGRLSRDEVERTLADARYVALPSSWDENAPLAALEAMASGKPLLVTSTGGLVELVENGEGLECPIGDVDAIAAAIVRLSTEDDLCRALGERAVKRADSDFTPEAHLGRLQAVYEKCLATKRAD
jgi:glycosyltransferase involved in cell wall biosynthesis